MTNQETYAHGHHPEVVFAHARRTIEDSAAYFAPHLRPGMRILDVGCGPGSVSCDLAAAVAPGSVTGIDDEPEVIDQAKELAASRSIDNIVFDVANAYSLPYEDDSFDAVHAHQLLQHVTDPVAVLGQMKRVVRPGGLIAARDADYGTMVHSPEHDGINKWNALYREVARRAGGQPDAGRRLAQWFAAADLPILEASSSTWTFATAEARRWWADSWMSRLLEARLGELAVDQGLADREALEAMAADWDKWASHPSGYFTFLHGEIVAIKP